NQDHDDGFCNTFVSGLADCTLREAINAANADSDVSEITFSDNFIITLGSDLPAVTTEMTIDGTGHSIEVNGADLYQVFYVNYSGILTIDTLTISHGSSADGGAIYSQGSVTVKNSTITQNRAQYGGGAIYITGNTNNNLIINTTVTKNQAVYG